MTAPKLTPAAKRDLVALSRGEYPGRIHDGDSARGGLRHGPWRQLVDAGFITGTQLEPEITDRGREVASRYAEEAM